MPLPDAPPPKSSRVYQQTTGKTVQSLTVENLDTISDPVFLDRNSEDELRRINLVGQATNLQSQSGPIPGTMEIKRTNTSSAQTILIFQPDAGQVWQVTAMSMDPEGSGAFRGIGSLSDGTNSVELFDSSGTGAAEALVYDTPLYLTNEVYLNFTAVTVDTSLAFDCAVIRVR